MPSSKIDTPPYENYMKGCNMECIMFKNPILKRYEKTDDGKIIVNVAVEKLDHLFNEFDATSKFAKRDLNTDFADYVSECVHEIRKNDFILRLDIPGKKRNKKKEDTVKKAIENYFIYSMNKQKIMMREIAAKTFFHFVISVLLFAFVLFVSPRIDSETTIHLIFIEGLTIAVWVIMWPVFSDFLYEWISELRDYNIYKRIRDCDVHYNYYTE
jgi:hypothetical protein